MPGLCLVFDASAVVGVCQLVEKLFRLRWSPEDGVGGIVITPTRELAMQIFDTLRCVGAAMHHCCQCTCSPSLPVLACSAGSLRASTR